MTRITAADVFETVEVDLWGAVYTLRQMTKTVGPKFDAAVDALHKLPSDAPDAKRAGAFIAVLDVLLAPPEGAPTAKVVFDGKWKDEAVGLDWLMAFSGTLQDEVWNRRRPTSPTMNGA